jgi:adenylate cyclase
MFLFADLAGFTAPTEAHGDERTADLEEDFCRQARELLPPARRRAGQDDRDALMVRAGDAGEAVRLAIRFAHEVGGRHQFAAVRGGLHTRTRVRILLKGMRGSLRRSPES